MVNLNEIYSIRQHRIRRIFILDLLTRDAYKYLNTVKFVQIVLRGNVSKKKASVAGRVNISNHN
jgi:hypothetical protein